MSLFSLDNVLMTRCFLGDTAWQWSFGDQLSLDISNRVLRCFRYLQVHRQLAQLGVHDVVPSYTALAVYFSDGQTHQQRQQIAEVAEQLIAEALRLEPVSERAYSNSDSADACLSAMNHGLDKSHRLPVHYIGEDLARVAEHAGIEIEEVIRRHTAPVYRVAMVGFLPHFPYLLGLDPAIHTPRLGCPRVQVAAGAVAIGGGQTGVYPTASPGGWNIIGYTLPERLSSVAPGDAIQFVRTSHFSNPNTSNPSNTLNQ